VETFRRKLLAEMQSNAAYGPGAGQTLPVDVAQAHAGGWERVGRLGKGGGSSIYSVPAFSLNPARVCGEENGENNNPKSMNANRVWVMRKGKRAIANPARSPYRGPATPYPPPPSPLHSRPLPSPLLPPLPPPQPRPTPAATT
jgi:hypothetical protein